MKPAITHDSIEDCNFQIKQKQLFVIHRNNNILVLLVNQCFLLFFTRVTKFRFEFSIKAAIDLSFDISICLDFNQ